MHTSAAAFIFDMDDTLYMRSEPFIRACTSLYPACASIPPEALYAVRKKHTDDSFFQHTDGKITREDMLIYRTKRTLSEFSITVSSADALHLEQLYEQELSHIRLNKDLEDILQYLNQKEISLGVITNGSAERQTAKLKALNLSRYIPLSRCIISGTVGAAKPDIKFFDAASQLLHLIPDSTWCIGDSWENDIVGASLAGWNTIWFNPGRALPPVCGIQADYTADSYGSLKEIILHITETK